jgi:hypothetical protein
MSTRLTNAAFALLLLGSTGLFTTPTFAVATLTLLADLSFLRLALIGRISRWMTNLAPR